MEAEAELISQIQKNEGKVGSLMEEGSRKESNETPRIRNTFA